jgi:cation:H+ antiporter
MSDDSSLKITLTQAPVKEYKNIEYYIGAIGVLVIGICFIFGRRGSGESLFYHLIMIFGALLVLLAASNIVLENAVKLAEAIGVSQLVIGLTFVSIGTSIPEIFTCIISALRNVGGFAVGDIYGSYITQLTLIIGIVILIIPRDVNRSFSPHILRDGGLVIISLIILSLQISDGYLSRWEAGFSMLLFFGYIGYLYRSSMHDMDSKIEQIHTINAMEQDLGIHSAAQIETQITTTTAQIKYSQKQIFAFIVFLLFGTLLTYFGADLVVDNGVSIARSLNVSEHIIAATIVGAGTAIPEMAVSVNAARRNNPDIAFGNLLGSNIVDPLFSVSVGVLIQPITLTAFAVEHILFKTLPIAIVVVSSIILMFSRKRGSKRSGLLFGIVLLGMYALFLFFSFFKSSGKFF